MQPTFASAGEVGLHFFIRNQLSESNCPDFLGESSGIDNIVHGNS